ncbi:hypothetical protein E4U54_008419, partial [Claviceps lovelessii]
MPIKDDPETWDQLHHPLGPTPQQTVFRYGADMCWTPMILAKEFNRNEFARDS